MFIVHSNIHMVLISTHVVRLVYQKQVCSLFFSFLVIISVILESRAIL